MCTIRRFPLTVTLLLSIVDLCLSTLCLAEHSLTILFVQLRIIFENSKTPSKSQLSFPCTIFNGTAHYNASSTQECPVLNIDTIFSLGGSISDLWILSIFRALTIVFSIFLTLRCCRKMSSLLIWWWALIVLFFEISMVMYTLIKTLVRLVDGPGSGAPPSVWFWSQILITTILSIPQCQYFLFFLHDSVEAHEISEEEHGRRRVLSSTAGMLQTPLLVQVGNDASLESRVSANKTGDDDDDDDDDGEQSENEDDQEVELDEYQKTRGEYSGILAEQYTLDSNGAATRNKHFLTRKKKAASRIAWFRPPKKKNKKNTSASIGKLMTLGYPDWPWLLTAFLALLVAAIGQARIPSLTGQLINEVSGGKDIGELRRCTTELVLTAMVTAVFTALRGSIFTLTMAKLNVRVRNKLFSTLLQQEMGFYDTVKTGDITSRLSADTTKMSDQISLNVNVFLRSVVQAIGVLFFMFRISIKMSVVTFTSVPAIVVLSKLYGDYYRELTKNGQKKLAAANSVAEEALGSMSTVKSFAAEFSETTDYSLKLQNYYFVNQRMAVAYTVYAVMFTALPNLVTALVLFYGGKLVIEGDLQPGDLVSFMLFQQSLSSSFNTIGNIWTGISGALGAADKIFEYIGREPKIPLIHHQQQQQQHQHDRDGDTQFNGTIDLIGCRLKYPSRPETLVLNNLTLTVRPGETIALVGPSGGGKSSCLRLINRLYLAEEGEVLLDGKDAHTFDHTWYHRKIAIVGQEPVLFGRSIRRNILYGLENLKGIQMEEEGMEEGMEPTMTDVVNAAKLANAHNFIMSFPKQYLTRCGEKGVALSGGQKQRIAIARALIRKPSILLLDEATSALDTESEAVVQRALDEVMQSRALTCIVVAHRLSTVQNANRILVIVDGSVLEVGTHAELLAKPDSTYRKLVHRQLHNNNKDKSTSNNDDNDDDKEADDSASAKVE